MNLHDLYSRYAGDVHRFALYLSGNAALADDLTSETFLRAWNSSTPIRESTVKAFQGSRVTWFMLRDSPWQASFFLIASIGCSLAYVRMGRRLRT